MSSCLCLLLYAVVQVHVTTTSFAADQYFDWAHRTLSHVKCQQYFNDGQLRLDACEASTCEDRASCGASCGDARTDA